MTDSADREMRADHVVSSLIGLRKVGPSKHALMSKRRADHDRVSKDDLETELRLNGLANYGEQSVAARELKVTEGCLRHWRDRGMPRCFPPRWALDRLRERREELWPSRRVAG